jgi:hypothetical protein
MGWRNMKKRPQVIQGMTLSTLFKALYRNDFQVDRQCFGRLAYLLVLGVFNSIYGACENYFNSEEIESAQIHRPPIFIIGHWRSGTTHLHNLMAVDENFACPTAYQALFPQHFVFSQAGGVLFNLLAPSKRPMDNVAFSANTPHEDEFALAAHSAVSPYMRVWFPVTGDNGFAKFDPKALPPEALNQWKSSFMLFIKKLTLSEGKQVVLKSPPHLGRVGTLLEMFPDAKFIHIVRNPYMVYASTHKLWRDSLAYAHLQTPTPELVDGLILDWYKQLFSLYERDKALIPADSFFELRYEDLEVEPISTMREMYSRLGLDDFDAYSVRLNAYLDSIRHYQKNNHNLTEADREKVATHWRKTFELYEYALE